MPYSKASELPEGVRKALPAKAQSIFMGAFNGSVKEYGEERAFKIAWGAVKKKFVKRGEKWVAREGVASYHVFERIAEAEFDTEARVIRGVTIIRAGVSGNRRYWPPETLQRCLPVLEGVACYSGHVPETDLAAHKSDPRKLVGHWKGVRFETATQSGKADLHYLPSGDALIADAKHLFETGMRDLVGISVDIAQIDGPVKQHEGQMVRWVDGFGASPANSIDIVVRPAAGGRLFESQQEEDEVLEGLEKLTPEELEKARPDLMKQIREGYEEDDKKKKAAAADKERQAKLDAEKKELAAKESAATREADETAKRAKAAADDLEKAAKKAAVRESQFYLTDALKKAELGPAWDAIIMRKFENRAVEAKEIDDEIKFVKERIAESTKEGRVNLPGGVGLAHVTGERRQKLAVALDGLFAKEDLRADWWATADRGTEAKEAKVPRFQSFKQAYAEITGDRSFYPRWQNMWREGAGYDSADRALESITVSPETWGEILGDSVTRRLLAEFRKPQWQEWRQLASDIVPVSDFRTQRRMVLGGYGNLETVGEGQDYPDLTSPTDDEVTYAITKKGGIDDLTEEVFANDDVGAIRRIPVSLARAAKRSLASYIFVTMLQGGKTFTYAQGSSTYLFESGNSNVSTTGGLTAALLKAGYVGMRDQTAFGNTDEVLGLAPKFLIVPNELYQTALELTGALFEASPGTTATYGAGYNYPTASTPYRGIVPIPIDLITDADMWVLMCDPASGPTFEVGFYQGREEPELFTQDLKNVGSYFDADKITYKVRYIWGVAVLDHRGFFAEIA